MLRISTAGSASQLIATAAMSRPEMTSEAPFERSALTSRVSIRPETCGAPSIATVARSKSFTSRARVRHVVSRAELRHIAKVQGLPGEVMSIVSAYSSQTSTIVPVAPSVRVAVWVVLTRSPGSR